MTSLRQAAQSVTARMYIDGKWRDAEANGNIVDPFSGDVVGTMPLSSKLDCDDALQAAWNCRETMARMPGYERAALLRRAASEVALQAEAIGLTMARETGKALRDCVTEVARSADTLVLCAEEAVRIEGEHIPMDASAMGAGRLGLVLRFPVGVVAAITPFNGPVNLAAHKIGPALAAGNTIVLKPSPKAPLSLHQFVEAIVAAGIPDGAVNTLFGDEIAPMLVSDPRVDFVSFTGSIKVGKIIRSAVGMKRVALELGGVGPTFVHGDADIAAAAKAAARNAMLLAGQSCISVQNVYVQRPAYEEIVARISDEVRSIRFGDPLDPSIEVGTLIDEEAAARVEGTVRKAIEGGAQVVCEGSRSGALLRPSVLTDVSQEMEIVRDETFGPSMSILPYDDIEPHFRTISESPYGLQAGIFTNSLDLAMKAYRNLRTGGVIVNGTSRWRSDQMPYGGVKDSGIGREGPKFSIRDMTEERLLVIN
jgi:acyl-CoA reductase-like NAD-dependent aldehyde dehydrogenase